MFGLKLRDSEHTVLVIEGDPAGARTIRAALAEWEGGLLNVQWAETLAEGVERLLKDRINAVLLDLSLPDCEGLEGFDKISLAAPTLPVLILTAVRDEGLPRQAVERGAHDYLFKTHLHSHSLLRALRGLIERAICRHHP